MSGTAGRGGCPTSTRPRSPGRIPIEVPAPAEDGSPLPNGSELVQTYYLAKPGPNLIFGAAPISKLYFPDTPVYELPDGTLRAGVQVDGGTVYTVVSQPPSATASSLRQADRDAAGTPPTILHHYAQPPVITPRVRDLAAQVTAGATTTYDKVMALEAWMAANTQLHAQHPAAAQRSRCRRPVPVRGPTGILRADRDQPDGDAQVARSAQPGGRRLRTRSAQSVHRPV